MTNLDGVFRREWGPAVAALARWSGDLTVADDSDVAIAARVIAVRRIGPARRAGRQSPVSVLREATLAPTSWGRRVVGGVIATAARAVNMIEPVCTAVSGLLAARDLPAAHIRGVMW